jgi:hypothetical protein
MAQAPRPGMPPPPAQQPVQRTTQVNIHGVAAPQPNMAPDEPEPENLGDNTRAEMEAGRKNLQQYGRRSNAEHEAGRRANRQRSGAPEPDPNDTETNP